jgi:hypothetical protein
MRRNFADPEYEPSDEDLAELIHETFAGIAEAREESLRQMRERIARAQEEVMRTFFPRTSEGS